MLLAFLKYGGYKRRDPTSIWVFFFFLLSKFPKLNHARLLRLDQNNCLVLVTQLTLAQNVLNRRLNTFLRAPARNWNHGDSWNEIVKSWWWYFPNGNKWYRVGMHGFHLGYRKLIPRVCPKARNVPFHPLKCVSCFFSED